jgi:threonine-phosphate decarboxylase
MLEGHGDDAWKYSVPIKADFSSNVWYGELDEGLREEVCSRVGSVTHYPEVDGRTVRGLAAAAFGVLPEQVLVTNGATEAIYLVAQLFAGGSATILAPAFAEYEDACRMHGMQVRIGAWPGTPGEGFGTDLVFICNPNNPTGLALPLDDLLRMVQGEPGVLFVVDESYIEFAASTASVLPALPVNVLVLRSLTKSCRIPGLRVGFVMGLLAEAAVFRSQLSSATGWRVHDSDTHYFLMETPAAFTAGQLKLRLVEEWGLLIRDASNFRGLGPHHFRVACQAPGDNQLLTEALLQCSQTGL